MNGSLGDLFTQGGWVMWPLLLLSVVAWAVVFERCYVFFRLKPRMTRLLDAINQSIKSGDFNSARQLCHTEKPMVGEIFLPALDPRRTRESAEKVSERNRMKLNATLRKNLWILGTIGSASPFIGLLGTVIGIVKAFHEMAHKGTGGFSVVAGGISEALIATAAGLVIAILAIIMYNVFVSMANQLSQGLKVAVDELMDGSFEQAPAGARK